MGWNPKPRLRSMRCHGGGPVHVQPELRSGDLHLSGLLNVLSCGAGGCVLSGQHTSCRSQHKEFDTRLPFSGQVAQDLLGEQGCWIGFCTDKTHSNMKGCQDSLDRLRQATNVG